MRSIVLLVLAALTTLLAAVKATGSWPAVEPTPRELAAAFLAATDLDDESPGTAATGTLFTDVAAELGIDFDHDNAARGKFYLPEEMGPGAAWLDYDGDADLDLFVAGGGAVAGDGPTQRCRLYRNDGTRFTDVTESTGAGVPGPAYGVAPADFDDDGDLDVFVSRLGPNAMLRNNGDGTFGEVAAAVGLADPGFGTSASWLDYDADGRLDLYVANYVTWSVQLASPCYTILGERDYCNPLAYPAATDRLYRNRGDGRFEDVTQASGIAAESGNGLGVLASDFDGDGKIDIYVANDQTPALLWRNEGRGRFRNDALLSGCAYNARGVAIAGMGVVCEDLDDDGDCDLLVTNIHDQSHLVLRNDAGSFQDISLSIGLGTWSMPATSFGVVLFDQDHDGNLDGFFANGEVNVDNRMPVGPNRYAQPDHFARLVDGRFVDTTAASGAAFSDVGRGLASGDMDNDGDVDLLVTNNGGPLRLLRNNNDRRGAWIIVDARTGGGNRSAIGARIGVTAAGRTQHREVRPQQSYLSSGDPRAHFGLGRAGEVERLEILWPDGGTTKLVDLPANRVLRVHRERGLEP